MARFRIQVDGEARLYEILDDELTAGAAAANGLRLQAPGVAAVHFRLRREGGTFRLAAVDAAGIVVNGSVVVEHRLADGDRIELAPGCTLEFVDPGRRPPARDRPVSAAEIVVPSVGRERRERADRRPVRPPAPRRQWQPLFVGTLVLAAALIFFAVKIASSGSFAKSAEDLVALAEAQFNRGNPERALQTARMALARGGSADVVARAEELRRRLETHLALKGDLQTLENARTALANLRTFETAYLADDPRSRPAAREMVRAADRWLERYAAVAAGHPDYAPLVAEVEGLRQRYTPPAALDQPDDADDVVFAARRLVMLRRPRYAEAVARLDGFLAGSPGEAERQRVERYRQEIVDGGRAWLDRNLELWKREWERGRREAVLEELQLLLTDRALPAWRDELERLQARWRAEMGR